MSKKLFSKIFILLLVVGLLFAATKTVQAQTPTVVLTKEELTTALADPAVTEIVLGADINVSSVSGSAFVIPSGKTITLDLNGHEISAETSNGGVFYNAGTLTISDTSVDKGGTIINTNITQTTTGEAAKSAISNNGVLTVNAGVIVAGPAEGQGSWGDANFNPAYGIDNLGGGKVTVNGATISGAYGLRNFANLPGTSITITDGIVTGKTGIAMQSFGTNDGTLTINGDTTITATTGSAIYAAGVKEYNQIVINGGTFSGPGDYGAVVVVAGTLDINGGTFTGIDGTYSLINYDATVNVTAGTFNGDIYGGDIEGGGLTTFAPSVGEQIYFNGEISGNVVGAELVAPVHNVTQDTYFDTIQAAIDVAADSDSIEVGPGTYDESLVIDVPNLTIKSTDGAVKTIIDVPYTEGVKTTGVKVLGTDLGVVTFDGFTVKNFTENGIIQGTASASGTSFHVLNNTVLPFVPESGVPYLRDGIQVSGDGSTVKGNYVEGGYLTPEWGSTGILVVNASNVLVEGNIISGEPYGLDMGIDVLNWGGTTVSNITITGNTITGADYPFSIETHGLPVYDVTISHNIVTDYLEAIWAGTWGDEGTEPTNVDASGNYWGSEYGPQSYVTGVTLTNWAIDDTFTVFAPEDGKITLTSDNSQVGAIKIYVPGISYYLTPGTVLQNSSPCFEVYANDAHIYTDYPAAAKCVPTEGSDGIWVADGVENLRVVNLEFDGTGQTTGDGIHFEGVVTNFQIINNYFHDLGGDAIEFVGAPAGDIQDVYGNYFVGTNGITLGDGMLYAAYNSWGIYEVPTAPSGVTVAPHTHAEIYVTPAVGGEVLKDSEVVFTVYGKIQSLTGAEFELSYPTAKLELVSAVANETIWDQYAAVDTTTTPGTIAVDLSAYDAISGDPVEMLTLTFKALAYADDLTLTFSETADVFAMYPLPDPSFSNHVYTFAQTGVTDLDIIGLPVVTITMDPEPYYAGIPIPFTVEVDNTNGGTYTGLTFDITLPAGSVLEYFDGTNWVAAALPFTVGELDPDEILTFEFRVTLDQPGDNTIAIGLMDGTESIGSDSVTITIAGNFSVLGTFAMQGRTVRSGIPVIFTLDDTYAPEFGTVDLLLDNLSGTLQYGGTYLITTNQPRYLNVTADLEKTVDVYADVTLEPLTLRGGNAIWENDNLIDLNDAGKITDDWGMTVDTDGDVNFDLKVNIQDLALVGGNMDLDSVDAYDGWDPVVTP